MLAKENFYISDDSGLNDHLASKIDNNLLFQFILSYRQNKTKFGNIYNFDGKYIIHYYIKLISKILVNLYKELVTSQYLNLLSKLISNTNFIEIASLLDKENKLRKSIECKNLEALSAEIFKIANLSTENLKMNKFKIRIKKILKTFLFIFSLKRKNIPCEFSTIDFEKLRPNKTGTTKKKNNLLINPIYDLQIIVPTYNNGKLLEKCIDSLLNQKTSYQYLIVIINDGSNDNTENYLKTISSENIIVITKKNGGLSSARNKGLETINSKYVSFVDGDDFVSPYFVQNTLDSAIKTNADIVEFDYTCKIEQLSQTKHYSYKKIGNKKLKGYMWNHIYKSSLFDNLIFPENVIFEDTINQLILFPKSTKQIFIKNKLYLYYQNVNGITARSTASNDLIDSYYVTKKIIEEYIEDHHIILLLANQ